MEFLQTVWDKLRDAVLLVLDFVKQLPAALVLIWEGSKEENGTHLFLIIVAVALGLGAIALLVSFLRASWREKLHRLLVLLIALLVVGVILWFALTQAKPEAAVAGAAVFFGG